MSQLVELEQAERIKKWCRDYGVGIFIGIVFAIILTLGWRYRQQIQENNFLMASIKYEDLLDNYTNNDQAAVNATVMDLLQKYPQTPYASLGALQLAKHAVYENRLAEAETHLAWVIRHGKSETLRALARIRLARVLLAEAHPKRALKMLDENKNVAYQPLILEEKGDVYLHLGHAAAALENYLAAEKLFSKISLNQPILAMKINNLMQSD